MMLHPTEAVVWEGQGMRFVLITSLICLVQESARTTEPHGLDAVVDSARWNAITTRRPAAPDVMTYPACLAVLATISATLSRELLDVTMFWSWTLRVS